jgi:hypothetical protein
MSLTESPIPEKRSELINIPVPMFSLNEVLRESMRTLYQFPGVIVRCESLPYIKGKHQEMLQLFDLLIGMITSFSPAAPKLFLYVDCDEGAVDTKLEPGFKKFVIKLHTNITTNDAWKERHRKVLADCERIVSEHKGDFQVNNISNTGCLFAISLAGKFA